MTAYPQASVTFLRVGLEWVLKFDSSTLAGAVGWTVCEPPHRKNIYMKEYL